jgi:hypothetical protein
MHFSQVLRFNRLISRPQSINIPVYSHIYGAGRETEGILDFVDGEYKQILRNQVRLSLQPTITRVISKFPALK